MSQTNHTSNWLGSLFIVKRWRDLNLRAKIILALLVIEVISISVLAYFAITRASQIVTSVSTKFENSVKIQTDTQLTNIVNTEAANADQLFSSTKDNLVKLADYRAQLESQKTTLSQGTYWDARTKVSALPEGQYGNSANDIAAVFIPNVVSVNDGVLDDINLSSYLDFSAPRILKDQTEIVAVYYVSTLGYTTYYPNINLASLVPGDFDARTQPFYTIATPQNDPERTLRWTDPYQDPAGTGLIVSASAPVYNANGIFKGVMSMDMQLGRVSENISQIKIGKTGFAFLVDRSGHILVMPPEGYALFGLQPEEVPVSESPKETILGQGSAELQAITNRLVSGGSGVSTVVIDGVETYMVFAPLNTAGYSLGVIVPTSELNTAIVASREEIQNETASSLLTATLILLGLLAGAILLSIGTGRVIAAPLVRLTQTVEQISSGDLSARAVIESQDETGTLASTFNRMASQLSESFTTLEARVAERTHNLELAAEVGRAVSQVRDLDVMLRDACELILKEFNLYYVQVYLTNPSQTNLVLEAGTGEVGAQLLGRGHNLPLNTGSINGRAATEKRSVVISNTAQSATFRQNPLLPNTRGEMAVPLIVANNVVGVLDMQSSLPGVLSEEVLPAFEALAGQLAVAIQNANLLEETEQARAQVEAQARRLVREGWSEHLDAIHKPEQLGFMFTHNQVTPLAEMDETQLLENGKAISVPIAVTGEALGSLVVEIDDETRREQSSELVSLVARQVAQQIENLRLLESAERYRYEAEQAVSRQTRENWQAYFQSGSNDKLSYLYDLNEVRQHNNGDETYENLYTLPLKVRDETIGRLSVQGLGSDDNESIDLINAVADRLTTHIEGIRQSNQTQSALAQSEKLFDISRNLTQATDLQELVKTAVATLKIPEINRAILVAFDYNQSDNVEGLDVIANWWNGTGQQATAIGTHYPLEVIRVMPMFISPTPVFFDDTFTDKRVDATTMQLVQRLNLRAVAVLPLHVGTGQIGALILEAEVPHHYTSEETRLFTAIAPQIATIMDNRRQFERAQQQAERESKLNVISQKIQSATTVEAVLQIAARELGHTLGASLTIAQLGLKDNPNGNGQNGN